MPHDNDNNVCGVVADFPMMESNANFWLAFLCSVLVVVLLVGPMTSRVNLLACAVVGSYAAIVPIDHYIGANLKYIFINIMRRATVPDFNQAIIDPPFQTKGNVHWFSWKSGGCWSELNYSGIYFKTFYRNTRILLNLFKKLFRTEFEYEETLQFWIRSSR